MEPYQTFKLTRMSDFIDFNPRESIKKNSVAVKVAMENVQPFTKKVDSAVRTTYTGGSKFRNGDTIMARITPCLENGKTAFVDFLEDGEVAFGSTEFIVLRAKKSVSDPQFIYYLAMSPDVRNVAIKSMVGSSGRQRVQQNVLNEYVVPLPDLKSQRTIGRFLATIDDKITLNQKINRNLEEQILALYEQSILLPNSNKTNGTIGNYCSVKSGYAFKSSWWTNEGIQVIKIKSIENGTINFHECSYVSKDKEKYAEDFKVIGGDLVIAMTGATLGKIAIVPSVDSDILVNQRVGRFFLGSNPLLRLPFIYCTLTQSDVIKEIINRGQGSAQANISPNDIMTTPCCIPSKETIDRFNKIGSTFFEKIIKHQKENQQLASLRDTLLPRLMSGELDVSSLEI